MLMPKTNFKTTNKKSKNNFNSKELNMKKWTALYVIAILAFGAFSVSFAANNAGHQVTVTVQAINDMTLTSGNVVLTISTQDGGTPDDATDASTTLGWATNGSNKKITIKTDQTSPTFTLKAVAQNASNGTAGSEVTLSTTPTDFISAIPAGTGSSTVKYTASATLTDGASSENHNVTYTITSS